MKARLTASLLALGLLAAGCEQPPGPDRLPPHRCAGQVLGLRAWLADLNALPSGSPVHIGPGVRLQVANIVEADRPRAGKPLVEIGPQRTTVGDVVVDGEGMEEALAALADEVRDLARLRKGGQWPKKILLAVDREASWSAVVRVTGAAAQAGFEHLVVLFAPYGAAQLPRPGASAIDAELDATRAIPDPVRKAPRMARLAKRVLTPCEGLDSVFRSLSVSNPDTRARVLTRMLPDAVADCGCQVDLGSLQALLWALFSRPAPIAARFDIVAEPHPEAYKLVQPGDRPWAQAHLLLLSVVRPGFSPRINLGVRQ